MDGLSAIAVLPHLWIAPAAVLAFLLSAHVLKRKATRDAAASTVRRQEKYPLSGIDADKWQDTGAGVVAILFYGLAGFGAVVAITLLIPFSPKYWAFYQTTGTVTDVTNTLIDASGELTNSPIVTIDSLGIPVEVSDPRILKTIGEEVTLTCSWGWVPYGRDQLSCFIAD